MEKLSKGKGVVVQTRIVVGADVVPTKSNFELFVKGDVDALVGGELKELLNSCDYSIFNLETPLTDTENPIKKCGANLRASTTVISGLKAINPHLYTLANNHIMDQGTKGLDSTIATLRNAGVEHAGVGHDLYEASRPHIQTVGEKKIGIYCCAEHEFSIATDKKPGANPFEPLDSFDHVEDLRRLVDYVIVLFHGGKEHYRYPSPYLQRVCRKFVDKGANLIICQHSHCIGCKEEYREGTIVYGQGNFLFDDSDSELWQTGLLVAVDEDFRVSYIPVVKKGNGVRLADEKKKQEILGEFFDRSEKIKDPFFVESEYSRFAEEYWDRYLDALSGKKSLFFSIANRLTKGKMLSKKLEKSYPSYSIGRVINYVNCEAHRELMLRAFGNIYNRGES